MRILKALGLISVLLVFAGAAYAQFAGGSGTETDPWQVATAEHLNNVRNYLGEAHNNKYFIQTVDIYLGGEWIPIGNEYSPFYGHYNGNDHVVDHLSIFGESVYKGLFGYNMGVLSNLEITNANVNAVVTEFGLLEVVGSLAGYSGGAIINCCASGYVRGLIVGGLVGSNEGSIENCKTSTNVDGSYYIPTFYENQDTSSTGGLVALNSGSIVNCYTNGNIEGTLSRYNDWGPGFFVSGTTGGLVSSNSGTISNCYSKANVTGTGGDYSGPPELPFGYGVALGGLVGSGGVILNSFFAGTLSGPTILPPNLGVCNRGGLVGYGGDNTYNCYWDIQTSGCTISSGGEGRTTDEMTYPYATNTYLGWDWRVWRPDIDNSLNDGYPYYGPLNETVTQVPDQAALVDPPNEAINVMPTTMLEWSTGFSYEYLNPPDGFRLWLGTDNPPTNICNNLDLGLQFSYDPDLENNTTYYWKVVPYNVLGDAIDCPIWTFETFDLDNIMYYPNGNETWQSGTTKTIRWRSDNPYGDSELHVSFDNGNQWILISAVQNSKGYHHYQVPAVNASNCLIKLASTQDENLYDASNGTFSISTSSTQPKVLLNNPSSTGLYFQVGDSTSVSWVGQNVTEVALDFSSDDGITWEETASGLITNEYQWQIPDTPSYECRIRVRSVADSTVLDISDNAFSISKITLLSPLGGEVLTSDYSNSSLLFITWMAEGMENVKIEYSNNAGINWVTIVDSTPAAEGSYTWTLPGIPSENYIIKVSNTLNKTFA